MLDESALFTILLAVYVAVCFGKIAHKHGKNPWLYGVLAIVIPVNLMILAYWAFSVLGRVALVLVNGEVALAGRYPNRAELARWAGIPQTAAEPKPADSCCSGSKCC